MMNPSKFIVSAYSPRISTFVASLASNAFTVHEKSGTLAHTHSLTDRPTTITMQCTRVNPLPTIGNSLKKQKSQYKVLTPGINPHINSMGLWELMTHICVIGW